MYDLKSEKNILENLNNYTNCKFKYAVKYKKYLMKSDYPKLSKIIFEFLKASEKNMNLKKRNININKNKNKEIKNIKLKKISRIFELLIELYYISYKKERLDKYFKFIIYSMTFFPDKQSEILSESIDNKKIFEMLSKSFCKKKYFRFSKKIIIYIGLKRDFSIFKNIFEKLINSTSIEKKLICKSVKYLFKKDHRYFKIFSNYFIDHISKFIENEICYKDIADCLLQCEFFKYNKKSNFLNINMSILLDSERINDNLNFKIRKLYQKTREIKLLELISYLKQENDEYNIFEYLKYHNKYTFDYFNVLKLNYLRIYENNNFIKNIDLLKSKEYDLYMFFEKNICQYLNYIKKYRSKKLFQIFSFLVSKLEFCSIFKYFKDNLETVVYIILNTDKSVVFPLDIQTYTKLLLNFISENKKIVIKNIQKLIKYFEKNILNEFVNDVIKMMKYNDSLGCYWAISNLSKYIKNKKEMTAILFENLIKCKYTLNFIFETESDDIFFDDDDKYNHVVTNLKKIEEEQFSKFKNNNINAGCEQVGRYINKKYKFENENENEKEKENENENENEKENKKYKFENKNKNENKKINIKYKFENENEKEKENKKYKFENENKNENKNKNINIKYKFENENENENENKNKKYKFENKNENKKINIKYKFENENENENKKYKFENENENENINIRKMAMIIKILKKINKFKNNNNFNEYNEINELFYNLLNSKNKLLLLSATNFLKYVSKKIISDKYIILFFKLLAQYKGKIAENIICILNKLGKQHNELCKILSLIKLDYTNSILKNNICKLIIKLAKTNSHVIIPFISSEFAQGNKTIILNVLKIIENMITVDYESLLIHILSCSLTSKDLDIKKKSFKAIKNILEKTTSIEIIYYFLNLIWYFIIDKNVKIEFNECIEIIIKRCDSYHMRQYLSLGVFHPYKKIRERYQNILRKL